MDLLRRLGIESTGPRISVQRRTVFYDTRRGKKYTHNKDVYVIYIRASSNINSYKYIGFTIKRSNNAARRIHQGEQKQVHLPLPQPFPNPSSK
jgi:hypothetical protein